MDTKHKLLYLGFIQANLELTGSKHKLGMCEYINTLANGELEGLCWTPLLHSDFEHILLTDRLLTDELLDWFHVLVRETTDRSLWDGNFKFPQGDVVSRAKWLNEQIKILENEDKN